jgi:hypothetical protein
MYLRATTTYGSLIPGSEYIRSLVRQGTISKDAAKRLRWMDHYARSQNARQTCRYFGISAQTFYRRKNRHDPYDLATLEEESRWLRHIRQPETPVKVIERIRNLREEHPRWGRDKTSTNRESSIRGIYGRRPPHPLRPRSPGNAGLTRPKASRKGR